MKYKTSLFDQKNKNLLEASKAGDIGRVALLLEKKADINTTSKYSNTPLILASKYNHPPIASYLLSKKALHNLTNFYHMTALMVAAHRGHNENIKLLIEAKADPDEKCFLNDYSAILFSINNKMTQSVRLLIDLGAKVPTEKLHGLCQTILSLWENQKSQYTLAILLISDFLPRVIWNIVTDYAVDFEPPSKAGCFCLSFWNRPKPISRQENQESRKNMPAKL